MIKDTKITFENSDEKLNRINLLILAVIISHQNFVALVVVNVIYYELTNLLPTNKQMY